jgi:hypothetical protein
MHSKTRIAGLAVAALLHACSSDTPADKTPGSGVDVGAPMDTPTTMQPVDMTPAAMTPSGTAGTAAPTPMDMKPADMKPVDMKPVDMKPVDMKPTLAMDECALDTKWIGDEYCILPPPTEKGFQLHIGPSNYDNPEPQYVLEPGDEVTESYPDTTGNDQQVYYYYRQYRMRPGSHHLIVYAGGGFGGRRLGGTQNLAKDNPDLGIIAPENQGVGMTLDAHSPVDQSLHYINLTEQPILKETWVNFWYRDAKDVKEPANEMFSMWAPMNVPPGAHVLLHGSCPITEAGRVLTLYGHRHANNLRFAAWHGHDGQMDLIFDDYNWEHPYIAEYSSLVENPPVDPSKKVPGGASGIMPLAVGDTLDFECEVVNMTDQTFVGQNEAKNDEMCILIGDTVGTTVPAFCEYTTTDL